MRSNIRCLQSFPARSTIQQRHRNTKSTFSYCIFVLWNDISFYVKKLIFTKLNELAGFLIITRNRYTSAFLVEITNRITGSYYSGLRIPDITCKVTRKNRLSPSIASTLILVIVAVPDDGPCTVISSTVTKLWNCKSMD